MDVANENTDQSLEPTGISARPMRMTSDQDRRRQFELLVDQIHDPLSRYLRRRMPIHDAEEVLDDVLVTLWRRLDSVPAAAPLAWTYGVARRATANHRRGDHRRLSLVKRLEAQPQHHNTDDEAPGELTDAIEQLSATEQEIIKLWAWEDLEPREIAQVLGMSANAISIRLTRIKSKLSEELRKNRALAGHNGIETTGDRP